MPHSNAAARAVTACLALFLGCCGPRYDGSILRKRDVDYRALAPEGGFAQVALEDNDLAFHKPNGGTIAVNATCRDYDDVPPAVLLNHLLFGMTGQRYLVDEEVVVDGRGARHAVVEAELDGVPLRAEIYVVVRSGCVFDLSYVSDRAAFDNEAFRSFVAGFHIQALRP
jgi:hypothetical protein